jgi:superfamily II DNA or RNA helicase
MEKLHARLVETGENACMFKESDVVFDRDCRILISSYQKVGTGFSFDKLDTLILGTDTEEYFLQYLGRVFRRLDVKPLIIDIVDEHPVLKRHFSSRRKVYQRCGGTIRKQKFSS